MAKLEFDIPDLLEGLDGLIDDVAPEMIDAALPIYQKAMQDALEPHKDTGELIKSLNCKKAKKTKTGAYIGYLTADGQKEDGFRNYQKALALEYGNEHEQAHPFMQKAVNSCEKDVLRAMQNVFEKGVK